jgi:hypothetical protein
METYWRNIREIFQNFCLEVITDVNTYAATLFVLTIKSVYVVFLNFYLEWSGVWRTLT